MVTKMNGFKSHILLFTKANCHSLYNLSKAEENTEPPLPNRSDNHVMVGLSFWSPSILRSVLCGIDIHSEKGFIFFVDDAFIKLPSVNLWNMMTISWYSRQHHFWCDYFIFAAK